MCVVFFLFFFQLSCKTKSMHEWLCILTLAVRDKTDAGAKAPAASGARSSRPPSPPPSRTLLP
jgi:hypothetical protein